MEGLCICEFPEARDAASPIFMPLLQYLAETR